MDTPFSVIIFDDHRMMQEGLSSCLESHGCTVVARLASLSELEALLKNGVPVPEGTIAIVDKQLGTESGCDAVSMINASGRGIKCIMYSAFYSVPSVMQALERGAYGYITKDTDGKELLSALETVSRGNRYVQRDLQEKMNLASVLLSVLSKKGTAGRRVFAGRNGQRADRGAAEYLETDSGKPSEYYLRQTGHHKQT